MATISRRIPANGARSLCRLAGVRQPSPCSFIETHRCVDQESDVQKYYAIDLSTQDGPMRAEVYRVDDVERLLGHAWALLTQDSVRKGFSPAQRQILDNVIGMIDEAMAKRS